jgi:hypothetical protein
MYNSFLQRTVQFNYFDLEYWAQEDSNEVEVSTWDTLENKMSPDVDTCRRRDSKTQMVHLEVRAESDWRRGQTPTKPTGSAVVLTEQRKSTA